MQAGTTGINTIRHNPVKNSFEQDPEGVFIKMGTRTSKVPVEHIHEPWKMMLWSKNLWGCLGQNYPLPIVHLEESARAARTKVWGHRKHPLVQKENKRILKKHVKRR